MRTKQIIMRFKKQFLPFFFLFKVPAILNQQTVLNTQMSLFLLFFFFSFFLLSFFSFKLSVLLSQVGSVEHKCLSFFLFSFLSFFFFSFLFFSLYSSFFYLRKSTRSFMVDETNLFSHFLSFCEYIYI